METVGYWEHTFDKNGLLFLSQCILASMFNSYCHTISRFAYYIRMDVLLSCVYVYYVCSQFPKKVEEGIRTPEIRVPDTCQLLCAYCEFNIVCYKSNKCFYILSNISRT